MRKPQKPAPVRVPSDDCIVEIGGEEYAVHAGEWVEVWRFHTVADTKIVSALQSIQARIDAIDEDDPERVAKVTAIAAEQYDDVLAAVRPRLVRWSWTDNLGQPLPQPKDEPAVLMRMRLEEAYYLFNLVSSEPASAEKNGSRPSRTSSSATPRRRSRTSSAGGRARMRPTSR